jgi:pimeloyl-ACP methyl ester carboxylesterase
LVNVTAMPRPLRFLCMLFGAATVAVAMTHAADTVVLLHGLGRSPLAMARLARDLRADGYDVRNIGYPSQHADIQTLAETTLGPVFDSAPAGTRIHLVTHSMGGILVRQYLHDHGTPASLGRVVMLAPPNAGSELVDRLSTWPLYRWINGPAGLQLGTSPDSVPNTLGPLPAATEVGVIAGNRSLNPLFSAWLTGPDDGKVTVASTHVANETDHLTVPHSHTWLMWRTHVISQVKTFLHTGGFSRVAG